MGKTFHAEKAEQEANKIGMKFAHSSDVVKDMSRAYNVDFSSIRVHTDSAADSRVKAAGKDALAQGNNLFFGKGIFESSEPDAKALVAHEFAHTMQQGVVGDAAVAESVPMGAAQGGVRDWFKRMFGKKEKMPESGKYYSTDGQHTFIDLDHYGKVSPTNNVPMYRGNLVNKGALAAAEAKKEKGGIKNWFKRMFGKKTKNADPNRTVIDLDAYFDDDDDEQLYPKPVIRPNKYLM